MRWLLLFNLLLVGCAPQIRYIQSPNLHPVSASTGEIKTIIKTVQTTNVEAIKQIELKLNEQETFLQKSQSDIDSLVLDNNKKNDLNNILQNKNSALKEKNAKLWIGIIGVSLLLAGSIALRFIQIKII